MPYRKSEPHSKSHQNAISREKRPNILIHHAANRSTQAHKQDSQHSSPPGPESPHEFGIQDRESADDSDGHAADEHEGGRGGNAFLEQSGLEDTEGLRGTDGPPAHHCAAGEDDPAMAAVGDGQVVVSRREIAVSLF